MRTSSTKIEQNRPPKIKVKSLMFQNLKNRITHPQTKKQDDQKSTQQNAHNNPEIDMSLIIKNIFKPQNSQQKVLRPNNQESLQSSRSISSKRLKLKDYLKLNQISRQKRKNSPKSKSIKLKQIMIQRKPSIDDKLQGSSRQSSLCMTFRPPELHKTQSQILIPQKQKNKCSFEQQMQIQKLQVLQLAKSTNNKLMKTIQMMQKVSSRFSNYNDLVFLFRIEEVLNQFLVKGVSKLNQGYINHFQLQSNKNKNSSNQFTTESLKSILNMHSPIKKSSAYKSPVTRFYQKLKEQKQLQRKLLQQKQKQISQNDWQNNNKQFDVLPVSARFMTSQVQED